MKAMFRFIVLLCAATFSCSFAQVSRADAMTGYWLPVDFEIARGYAWLEDTGFDYGCKNSSGNPVKVYHPGSDLNERGTAYGGDYEKDHWRVTRAIGNGTVVFADDSKWASLIIRHDQGQARFYSVYGHSEITPRPKPNDPSRNEFTQVVVGDEVTKGQVIGYVWDNNTTDAHLHFEVRKSSHSDPENGSSWCGFLGGKTQDDIKASYVDPEAFSKSDGYSAGTCASMSASFTAGKQGSWVFCWMDPAGQSDVACEYATAHKLYQKLSDGRMSAQWTFGSDALRYHCQNTVQGPVDIVRYLTDVSYVPSVPGGSDPGGGPVTPPPSTEPRNDLVPHVDAFGMRNGREVQVTADSLTGPTLPVIEGEALRVEQIMDSKYSDASTWFRERFNSILTTAWFQIVSSDKTKTLVPWTEIFTRKFDPGRLEKDESYGESTNFVVPSGYAGHWLVIASCADPTDRVLERDESTTRRSPATNPDSCGTNNTTRKEWLRIQPKPKVLDYVVQNGGMVNAPPYLWINETFRPWYEAVNQGVDTQEDRIAVSVKRIDPTNASTLIQNRYIEPGTLVPNTTYLDQLGMNVIVYGPPGTHRLEFCINTEGKPESNTGNNCLSKPFEVRHPDMSYPCGLITPDTWLVWSAQPYGAPFDFFDGNRPLISPSCRKTKPDSLDMTFGKDADPNVLVYKTVYIQNGKTKASDSFSVNCRNADLGAYCEGGAWLNISGLAVDTSSATQPTLILAYTCHLVNGQWKCGCKDANCSSSGWQQQAAGFVR